MEQVTVPRVFLVLAWVWLAGPVPGAVGDAPAPDALLERFAPVVIQRSHGRADYITRFDYDGNTNGADNWENLDRGHALKAHVYASAIESASHVFLTYALFHPRDYWPVSLPMVNHENDLEGVQVVLEKRPRARGGVALLAMETIFHGSIKRYSSDPSMAGEALDGRVAVEGERPILDVEAYKHGIRAFQGTDPGGAKGIVYRHKGVAQEPRPGHERDVGYALLSIHDTFFALRLEVGRDKAFGEARTYPMGTFGALLNGDNYGRNKANAPWNWSDGRDKGLAAGDWFFDPARAMQVHYPSQKGRFDRQYLFNPYLYPCATRREMRRAQTFELLSGGSD